MIRREQYELRRARTILTSTLVGDRLVTAVSRLNIEGSESTEVTGVHEIHALALEPEAGREMVLPQRALEKS